MQKNTPETERNEHIPLRVSKLQLIFDYLEASYLGLRTMLVHNILQKYPHIRRYALIGTLLQ